MFPLPSSLLPSASVPKVAMWGKPLQIEHKNTVEVRLLFFSCLNSYLDHEKSSESATSFNQTLYKL